MDNGLFRKKSLEHISSPEALHDYMRVTSPRLWMILAAILVLLTGFIVYAATARMENTMKVKVQLQSCHNTTEGNPEAEAQNTSCVSCRLPLDRINLVKTGMTLRLGEEEGHISRISTSEEDEQIAIDFEMDHVYIPMDDGEYDAELVLESTTPISFLWN